MTERLPDWPVRWRAYLCDVARRGFEPGIHDCGQFAAGAVEALTGHRVHLPIYQGLAGAMAALRERGWTTLRDACQEILGAPIDVLHTQTGDVVWMPWWPQVHGGAWPRHIGGLGVCDSGHVLLPGRRRLATIPRPAAIRHGGAIFPVGVR